MNIFTNSNDLWPKIGSVPKGAKVHHVMPEIQPDSFAAHIKTGVGAKNALVVESSPEYENSSFYRRRANILFRVLWIFSFVIASVLVVPPVIGKLIDMVITRMLICNNRILSCFRRTVNKRLPVR